MRGTNDVQMFRGTNRETMCALKTADVMKCEAERGVSGIHHHPSLFCLIYTAAAGRRRGGGRGVQGRGRGYVINHTAGLP